MIIQRVAPAFQPQGVPPANTGSSLASGLIQLVNCANGRDMITGVQWSMSQGRVPGLRGLGANVVTWQTTCLIRPTGLTLAAGADFTMLFLVSNLSYNGSNPGVWRDGSTNAGGTFCIFNAATGRPWIRINGSDTPLKPVSGYQLAAGTSPAFAFRVRSAKEAAFASDGFIRHTNTHAVATVATSVWNLGFQNDGAQVVGGSYAMFAIWNRALTDAEMCAATANPWQLFAPVPRYLGFAAAATNPTGTSATTNANDTSAASGTSILNVTGTLARTNANDTVAASGTSILNVTGTLARTNANDTSAASGTSISGTSGTSATTNANDIVVASGTSILNATGTLARTNANDTVVASGTVGQNITGTLSVTNANDTASTEGSASTRRPRRHPTLKDVRDGMSPVIRVRAKSTARVHAEGVVSPAKVGAPSIGAAVRIGAVAKGRARVSATGAAGVHVFGGALRAVARVGAPRTGATSQRLKTTKSSRVLARGVGGAMVSTRAAARSGGGMWQPAGVDNPSDQDLLIAALALKSRLTAPKR